MGDPANISDLETIFGYIITVVLELLAIVLFIMIVLGGAKYLTSSGDPKKTDSAKKTLTYAIFGAILMIASVLLFVFIEEFFGLKLYEFKIGLP